MTDPIWQQIARTLTREIEEGRFASGGRLPTESALAQRFAVNRHTVRRALGAMREQGLVHSRRGAGVFVTAAPVPYRLGSATRFTRNLAERGLTGSREILRAETVLATRAEAAALDLAIGAPVHVTEIVGSIDGVPALHARSVFPADALAGFLEHLRQSRSITAALAGCGIADYRRVHTRLTAERASGATARHLHMTEGAPIICAVSLNSTLDGRPIEFGRTLFCADRVELIVDAGSVG